MLTRAGNGARRRVQGGRGGEGGHQSPSRDVSIVRFTQIEEHHHSSVPAKHQINSPGASHTKIQKAVFKLALTRN